jgi:hypothetical protein
MDKVEDLLVKRKWKGTCLRLNIAQKDDIITSGKSGNFKVEKVMSSLLPNKEKELKEAIQYIAPEWWVDETQVILSNNVTCKRHKDSNVGHSWIIFLGDFEGGALCFEDGTKLEKPYIWYKIDGQIPHWNEPHTGCKYSIVLYRRGAKKTKVDNIVGVLRKVRHKKAIEDNDCDKLAKEFLELLAKALENGDHQNIDDWIGQIKGKLLEIYEEKAKTNDTVEQKAEEHDTINKIKTELDETCG